MNSLLLTVTGAIVEGLMRSDGGHCAVAGPKMTAWPTARASAGCFVGGSNVDAQAVKIVPNRNSATLIGPYPCIHYPVATLDCRMKTLSVVCCKEG